MKTHVEAVGAVRRKLTIDVPVEAVAQALEAAYAKIQKTAKLKGFREGKVPRHLLEQYYRSEAEHAAMEALVRETYPQASADLRAVAQPQIEPGPFAKDQAFRYTATVEVQPVIALGTYTGFSLAHAAREVSDDAVAAQLQAARESLTQLVPVAEGETVADGMVVRIDFDGTADGKPFEGSNVKDYVMEIGSGKLLPEFETQIRGMKVGEERSVALTYPEDYFNINLAGARGEFRVVLKEVKRKVLPELSDDLAKDLGDFQTLADVRAEIRKQLEALNQREIKAELGEQAMKEVLAAHPFEVPVSMVMWELEVMYRDLERRAKAEGKQVADLGITPEQFATQYEETARERVRGGLLLDAIVEAEKQAVTENELDQRLDEIAKASHEPTPKVRLYYEQNKLFPSLKRQILHEKALDFVIGKSKIKVEKVKSGKKGAK